MRCACGLVVRAGACGQLVELSMSHERLPDRATVHKSTGSITGKKLKESIKGTLTGLGGGRLATQGGGD